MDNNNILNKLYKVALSKVYRLEVKADRLRGYVKWGKKNDYPNYLLALAENQAEHGAILNKKSEYLTGLGLDCHNQNVLEWLKMANPDESWVDIKKKCDIDKPIFGAFAMKVVPNVLGQPLYFYHVDYGKLRMALNGEQVIYSEDWQTMEHENERIHFPLFYPGCKTVSILIYKDYFPTSSKIKSFYGKPEYSSVITDIDTDVRVATYYNVLVQNNFNPGALVTIFKNNPTKEEKEYVSANLKNDNSGEENAGNIVITYTDNNGKGAEVTPLSTNNLDKQYVEVGQRCQNKIIIAHGINPVLAGLQTDGKLGVSQELMDSHQLFINTYAKPNQKAFINIIEYFYKLQNGIDISEQVVVKQLELIGEALPLDNNTIVQAIGMQAFASYVTKRFGIETNFIPQDVAPIKGLEHAPPANTSVPTQQNNGNDWIRTMKRSQLNNMMKICADYENGKKTLQQTVILLQGFGLSSDEAMKFISYEEAQSETKLSKQAETNRFNFFLSLVNQYSRDVNDDDEVLERVQLNNFSDIKLSINVRLGGKPLTVNQLRNSILNQLKFNPEITADELSDMFGIDTQYIQTQFDWLSEKHLIESTDYGWQPTKKGLTKAGDKPAEIYTEYHYDKRDDVSGTPIIKTSRQFCKKMYALYAEGKKALRLEDIEKITNDFGENAFDYRGGFYNDGKETTPWCRHVWVGQTKIKRG